MPGGAWGATEKNKRHIGKLFEMALVGSGITVQFRNARAHTHVNDCVPHCRNKVLPASTGTDKVPFYPATQETENKIEVNQALHSTILSVAFVQADAMKMKKYITAMLICFGTIFAHPSIGAAVTGTNITIGDGAFSGADYALTVYQDEAATDPTSIFFDISGSELTIVNYNIDEASDWFFTFENEEFSASSIQSDTHPVFIRHTPDFETNVLDVGFGEFFLGVNTGNTDGAGFPPRNLYGWARLRNTAGNLTLEDNAMTYSGSGIIVGTTQVIPEPALFGLFIAGGAILTMLRLRQREQNN